MLVELADIGSDVRVVFEAVKVPDVLGVTVPAVERSLEFRPELFCTDTGGPGAVLAKFPCARISYDRFVWICPLVLVGDGLAES
jgi:hypothetical protein